MDFTEDYFNNMNDQWKKLGDFLKKSRENVNLSQDEVSTHFGYSSPQFVSNWERGKASPPLDVIIDLAEIYQISSNQLFKVILEATVSRVRLGMIQQYKEASKKRKNK